MRWSPGPRSPNLEDRRFEWSGPEAVQGAIEAAARRGDLMEPWQYGELPPWIKPPGPTTQEALLDELAFRRAFGVE